MPGEQPNQFFPRHKHARTGTASMSRTIFYIPDERHTLASALRCVLEDVCVDTDELVSCTLMHPLDDHIEVRAPSESVLRESLLKLKDMVRTARHSVSRL